VKFRRQKRRDEGINLTPLIDVVFLLLIFFMVATTFTSEARLEVQLPEAKGNQSADEQQKNIEIIIDSTGGYAVNGTTLVNRDTATLVNALRQAGKADISLPVIITADGKASHQSVIRAMDAAGRAGFTRLSFSTQEPQEKNTDE